MSFCIINQESVDMFIASFPNIYKEFMDYGGTVFSDLDTKVRVKKLFFACAICNNMNWDFLCQTAIPQLFEITHGFEYSEVCLLDTKTFENVFSDYPKKHKIEAINRIEMLKKLSNYTSFTNKKVFDDILHADTLSGEKGLSNIINSIPVFEDDPLHKKGNLLIQILLREGIVDVKDEINVEPSIDYHVIRFFLRYGFFELDEKIIRRLSGGESFSLEETTLLRQSIADCMKELSRHGISIAKMGFIAWSIGRTYCRVEYAACERNEYCPVSNECCGKNNQIYRGLREPESNVGFY